MGGIHKLVAGSVYVHDERQITSREHAFAKP